MRYTKNKRKQIKPRKYIITNKRGSEVYENDN
jgi:hypothetical protein